MNIKELEAEYNKLNQLKSEFHSKCSEYALSQCPFKVGYIVNNCGHIFNGKPMLIESIEFKCGFGYRQGFYVQWVVLGCVLKTNGDKSKNKVKFDQIQYEQGVRK